MSTTGPRGSGPRPSPGAASPADPGPKGDAPEPAKPPALPATQPLPPLHLPQDPPPHGILRSPLSASGGGGAKKTAAFDILNSNSNSSCATQPDPDDAQDEKPGGRRSRLGSAEQFRRRRTVSGSKSEDHIMRTQSGGQIFTKGRPPWFDCGGQMAKRPMLIGICGGSGSGKTTVAEAIIKQMDIQWVTHLSMDSFYQVLTAEQHEAAARGEYDFDHPDATDLQLLLETLSRLKEGKAVSVPVYNFASHSREKAPKTMYGADVIIFEGIYALYHPEINRMLDLKIFVDTDGDTRLARRLQRDIAHRGRCLESVLGQYRRFVKPAYDNFVAPCMKNADIHVHSGGENEVAIHMIAQNIRTELAKRGYFAEKSSARRALVDRSGSQDGPESRPDLPERLFIVPETPQTRGIHTFIRNRRTPRDEFIFYSKRLMRILIEAALAQHLDFQDETVQTPQGPTYDGVRSGSGGHVCGVSIMRAGETMETALREVVKDAKMGKILIQTNHMTQEPELHFKRLPAGIPSFKVLLMDATVATGAAAIMAIRVLIDHDVPEENICLCALLMATTGVQSVAYAFPRVRLVTTAVDPALSPDFHILPGVGNFGDRYYGTSLASDDEGDDDDEVPGQRRLSSDVDDSDTDSEHRI